jgi:tubulin polyglutamylase TTLL6/13
LHKPYLIEGLKFDFRIYVLLASVDPLRVYLYNEGLARFATEPYVIPTKENMEEVCMHLTNYAINKDNPNFVFNESAKDMSIGHKRSLTSVFELLAKQGLDVPLLKEQIKDILIKTFISGLPLIRHQYRSCQLENYAANMCF